MATPKNPPDFNALTAFFCPYADEVYGSIEKMIDAGWEGLVESEAKVAKAFIDDLLSGHYTENELREVWRNSKAAIAPFRGKEGSCRAFLESIRERYPKYS
ncbi:hypothetical protein AMST5_00478 [freshwater sediment metagenome]|jgi:hypothetical protein|uniref:CdiI immunity protein domain-containing protein n=1 Tax=freshwater sediment metagenome TaxID=556182 RepID=A0AA48LYG1_9ZZZZ